MSLHQARSRNPSSLRSGKFFSGGVTPGSNDSRQSHLLAPFLDPTKRRGVDEPPLDAWLRTLPAFLDPIRLGYIFGLEGRVGQGGFCPSPLSGSCQHDGHCAFCKPSAQELRKRHVHRLRPRIGFLAKPDSPLKSVDNGDFFFLSLLDGLLFCRCWTDYCSVAVGRITLCGAPGCLFFLFPTSGGISSSVLACP
jgi:hypothetical protein